MTRRSWRASRPYVLGPLALGMFLLLAGWRKSGLAMLGAALLALGFFRDPERRLEPEPDVLYAAADGMVMGVEEVEEPWLSGERARRVSTFLSLHNVHVNRGPVTGTVAKAEEIGGGFAPAFLGGAEENRRVRLAVDGERGRVVVVQRSGMVARRISRWVEAGEEVEAGQRIGLIHFGSRTDVLIPTEAAEVLVRPGDRVRAGLTPIARYRQ